MLPCGGFVAAAGIDIVAEATHGHYMLRCCESEHFYIPQRKAYIAGLALEELHALRSVGAVYMASP